MRGRSHAIFALALTAPAAVWLLDPAAAPAMVEAHLQLVQPDPIAAVTALGFGVGAGLGPDVDEPRSTAGQEVFGRSWPRFLRFPLPHRGPTHWILTGVVLAALTAFVASRFDAAAAPLLGLVVAVGWASHGFLDLSNKEAVDWFGPFIQPLQSRFGVYEDSKLGAVEEWITRGAAAAFILWTAVPLVLIAWHLLTAGPLAPLVQFVESLPAGQPATPPMPALW